VKQSEFETWVVVGGSADTGAATTTVTIDANRTARIGDFMVPLPWSLDDTLAPAEERRGVILGVKSGTVEGCGG
jgi:hypothetical protein